MSKIVLTLGSIAGIILVIMLGLSLAFSSGEMDAQSMKFSEIIGYATMIIALSLIFFGVRAHRDNALNGHIGFGQAFQIGLLITLVASFFYVVGWMILSNILAPDFMDQYAEFTLKSMQESGASVSEIKAAEAEMEKYRQYYENPLLKAGLTFMEIFPVGLIISLISAIILRKK
ncbi:MAG: DUF4199 domain-containing protein [Saprospiraceae bacterium]|nr:DUF4199 domain-containing protein [Saprospiraceae bacterium]